MKTIKTLAAAALSLLALETGARGDSLSYNVELSANASSGRYAPLWFTANRYGLSSERPNSGYLRAGVQYDTRFGKGWSVQAGVDLAGAVDMDAPFIVQQAYADLSWKVLTLSVGAKERSDSPLDKDFRLSGGAMVEGPNARPIPQVRLEVKKYWNVPFTKGWLGVKGHFGYGMLTDNRWRENFVAAEQAFTKNEFYHSKSLMFRVGNAEVFPLTMEIGMLEAAQFGGSRWQKEKDGSLTLVQDMPDGVKEFIEAIVPVQKSTLENVEGNHVGSWNFALNYEAKTWRARLYYEHFYDDHSQLTWQYGRWKDGQIGVEVTLPRNPFVTKVLWEGLSTYDQTGPILYDGVGGSFGDLQMSGGDNYYTNGEYLGWQHAGLGLGHPFLPGPAYNTDGSNMFKSNRVRANHLGMTGDPSEEWNWRVLVSFARHWGTYSAPLDKPRKQFGSLWEVTYRPKRLAGWSFSAALGLDRGNYLPGNTAGGTFCIRKTGELLKR